MNIFGKGRKDASDIYIVGEAKSRLARKHVDAFLKMVKRLREHGVISDDAMMIMVSYTVKPEVHKYATDKGVTLFWSYELSGPREVL